MLDMLTSLPWDFRSNGKKVLDTSTAPKKFTSMHCLYMLMGSSSPSAGKPRTPALFTTPQSPGKRRKHRANVEQEIISIKIKLMSWMVPWDQSRGYLQIQIHSIPSLNSHHHFWYVPESRSHQYKYPDCSATAAWKPPTHISRNAVNR